MGLSAAQYGAHGLGDRSNVDKSQTTSAVPVQGSMACAAAAFRSSGIKTFSGAWR